MVPPALGGQPNEAPLADQNPYSDKRAPTGIEPGVTAAADSLTGSCHLGWIRYYAVRFRSYFVRTMAEPLDQLSEQIASRFKEAGSLLSEAETVFRTETTAQHRDQWPNVYRLESATALAQKALMWADPRITPEAAANELVDAATQARNVIREAVTTGGGSLIEAAENLLRVVDQLGRPPLTSEEEAGAAQTKLKEVQSELEELISRQDAKFSEAQDKWTERLDNAFSQVQSDLTEGQSKFARQADQAQDHIKELEEDISKTAAELGGKGIAIDNHKESEEQTSRAFWWTLGVLAFAAGLSIFIGIEDSDQSPESVAGKITVALILAGIAGYTAGVARHHRQRAATARRLAIELIAFGPFIAPLEKVDRDDIRSTIVWRFFGPPDALNQAQDAAPTPGPALLQQLKDRRNARKPPETTM